MQDNGPIFQLKGIFPLSLCSTFLINLYDERFFGRCVLKLDTHNFLGNSSSKQYDFQGPRAHITITLSHPVMHGFSTDLCLCIIVTKLLEVCSNFVKAIKV